MMDLWDVLGGIGIVAPYLAVWLVAMMLSTVLMKRRGGRPARFLVIGSSLMLVSTLINGSQDAIADYARQNGFSVGVAISYIGWSATLISLPGIICLFYAVWKKFNERTRVDSR
jgi:hypothetical protein